ncbi:MAG: sigma-54-dependent Fis family transcriptional regulator, partial [Rhodospirillales bacterium]|nr:sigma-54-dependent Fis family transcriptional regulator [Rhodospirillales bacterium]
MARLLVDLARSNPALANQLRRRLEALPTPAPAVRAPSSSAAAAALIGDSPAMQRVRREIRQFAASDAAVLITGETGTGKELAAHAVHLQSRCARGPFIAINCAGLPPTLVSSELFGHERGAFTGANQRKIGRIEAARGGTVFLDEIGDFPFEIQAHLLRFLQEKTVERIGGCQPVPVDVRVVAATNKDLAAEVREGRFREDLYFRLHVLRLHLPPLIDRGRDIELLGRHFLALYRTSPQAAFSDEAMAALRAHRWPGNVRELIGRVRRAAVVSDGGRIGPGELGLSGGERRRRPREPAGGRPPARVEDAERSGAEARERQARPADDTARAGASFCVHAEAMPASLGEAKRNVEVWMLRTALRLAGNNMTLAAERLGVSRVTLYRLFERHALRGDAGLVAED